MTFWQVKFKDNYGTVSSRHNFLYIGSAFRFTQEVINKKIRWRTFCGDVFFSETVEDDPAVDKDRNKLSAIISRLEMDTTPHMADLSRFDITEDIGL